MDKETEIIEETPPAATETITKDIETHIEQKEEDLATFQEVQTDDIEEDEDTPGEHGFKHWRTAAALVCLCVSGVALYKGVKNKQKDQISAFGG